MKNYGDEINNFHYAVDIFIFSYIDYGMTNTLDFR